MTRLASLRDKPGTAREYETIYILRPNTPNEGVAEVNTRIKGVMNRLGWSGPDLLYFDGKRARGYRRPA